MFLSHASLRDRNDYFSVIINICNKQALLITIIKRGDHERR